MADFVSPSGAEFTSRVPNTNPEDLIDVWRGIKHGDRRAAIRPLDWITTTSENARKYAGKRGRVVHMQVPSGEMWRRSIVAKHAKPKFFWVPEGYSPADHVSHAETRPPAVVARELAAKARIARRKYGVGAGGAATSAFAAKTFLGAPLATAASVAPLTTAGLVGGAGVGGYALGRGIDRASGGNITDYWGSGGASGAFQPLIDAYYSALGHLERGTSSLVDRARKRKHRRPEWPQSSPGTKGR